MQVELRECKGGGARNSLQLFLASILNSPPRFSLQFAMQLFDYGEIAYCDVDFSFFSMSRNSA